MMIKRFAAACAAAFLMYVASASGEERKPFLSEAKVLPFPCAHGEDSLSGAFGKDPIFFLPEGKRIAGRLELIHCRTSQPRRIAIVAPRSMLPLSFDGFEAIVGGDGALFLTVEERALTHTAGYIAKAEEKEPGEFTVTTRVRVPLRSRVDNRSVEALVRFRDRLYVFEEVNFPPHNNDPVAHVFDLSLKPVASIPSPRIPYRVTDASQPDEEGKFWVINYFWPGDGDLKISDDPIVEKWGEGETHAHFPQVERLVQLQIREDAVVLTDRAPIYLELTAEARNWEALVQRSPREFVLATDTFPRTMIGVALIPE